LPQPEPPLQATSEQPPTDEEETPLSDLEGQVSDSDEQQSPPSGPVAVEPTSWQPPAPLSGP
jgi:hypothetical protein